MRKLKNKPIHKKSDFQPINKLLIVYNLNYEFCNVTGKIKDEFQLQSRD
jgi:hypothetical protein